MLYAHNKIKIWWLILLIVKILENNPFIRLSKEATEYKKVIRRLLKTKLKLMCWNSIYADGPPEGINDESNHSL